MTSPITNRNAANWQRSPWVRLATVLLVVGFLLLRPKLDEWFNGAGSTPQPKVAESSDEVAPNSPVTNASENTSAGSGDSKTAASDETSSKKSKPLGETSSSPRTDKKATQGTAEEPAKERLTEIRPDVYESLAGLIYGKGSEDGHRLKHIMQHAEDEPSKKVHGVYEGDREQILEWIDDVWTRYQNQDSTVRSSLQNSRIVITAKMNERIGYVGGEEGERKGHPECRFLRLVVDKPNKIVTAYPVQSY